MKWLLSKWMIPVLIIAACFVALWVFWRLKRGRKAVLPRRISPRLVRIAAIILVFLSSKDATEVQAGAAEADRPGTTSSDLAELPAQLTEEMVNRWRLFHASYFNQLATIKKHLTAPEGLRALSDSEFKTLRDRIPNIVKPLTKMIVEDLQEVRASMSATNVSVDRLLAALDTMEEHGLYDQWFNAYLWRKARGINETEVANQLTELFRRIELHARITDALIRAQFEVKPTRFNPRAWMSKAGPSRQMLANRLNAAKTISAAARKLFPDISAGTWYRDAVLRLKLDGKSGPAIITRAGKPITIQPGETFAFGRLDLLKSKGDEPLLLEDLEFGRLHVPANTTVSAWSLPSFLARAGERRLQETLQAALDGDARAARRLELALPLSHKVIRRALRESPQAAGAARLRMILSLFDDSPSHFGAPQVLMQTDLRILLEARGRR